jgi:hypothetical protein
VLGSKASGNTCVVLQWPDEFSISATELQTADTGSVAANASASTPATLSAAATLPCATVRCGTVEENFPRNGGNAGKALAKASVRAMNGSTGCGCRNAVAVKRPTETSLKQKGCVRSDNLCACTRDFGGYVRRLHERKEDRDVRWDAQPCRLVVPQTQTADQGLCFRNQDNEAGLTHAEGA